MKIKKMSDFTKKLILIINLTVMLSGCLNSQDMHWKEIETQGTEKSKYNPGIGTNYQFNKFIFISSKTGFFVGNYNNQIDIDIDNVTWNSIHLNEDAVILRTIDGGYHWKESILGKGDVTDLQHVENTLIALRESYHGTNADEIISHIHISSDNGATWKEVSATKEVFDEIHFWTPQKGIATMGLRGYVYNSLKFVKTEDGGKTWEAIRLPNAHEKMDFRITSKGFLYYLTESARSYMKVDLNTLKSEEISLNFAEKPFSIVMDNKETLYFVAEDRDKRNVMYYKAPNNIDGYEKIAFPVKNTMINDAWIFDNIISIIVDKDGGSYYRSEDHGKTWKQEKFSNTYIRNIAFYGKDNIWIRTIPGKMLIRE